MSNFIKKTLFLFSIIAIPVIYTDQKGYFFAEHYFRHVHAKMNAFYKVSSEKNVDVIILGNSHACTSINPILLSEITGNYCFILGNPGTGIPDSWFQLGEGLKHTKPKLVIIETYCINEEDKYTKKAVTQIQTLESNRDFWYKLKSTPELLPVKNWLEAWSQTIRNHHIIFKEPHKLVSNIQSKRKPQIDENRGMRPVLRLSLQDSILQKYETEGPPVDGEKKVITNYSKKYLSKTVEMCKSRGIPILFVTAPMYFKHVKNYTAWEKTLSDELQKYQENWLNLQNPYDTAAYTPNMFENTYDPNQHISVDGMAVTTKKIADYLKANYPDLFPPK
jgi:hypothetical protein